MHPAWDFYALAFNFAQTYLGPPRWRLWVWLLILLVLWRFRYALNWKVYEDDAMSSITSISWLFYSTFWLGLHRGQVSVCFEWVFDTNVPIWKHVIPVLFRCDFCHSNKLESVFECEVSRHSRTRLKEIALITRHGGVNREASRRLLRRQMYSMRGMQNTEKNGRKFLSLLWH